MNINLRAIAGFATAYIAAMCSSGAFAASDIYARPDFAYPRTVETDARGQLANATDPRAMLRALINLSLAQTAISADNLPGVIERITSLIAQTGDPATKALLETLLAQAYAEVYAADRSTYDERPVTTSAPSADYRTWSGALMQERINALLDSALATGAPLDVPLERMNGVIDYDPKGVDVFHPTLRDFVADRALSIYVNLGRADDDARKDAAALTARMIALSAANPAEQLLWELRALDASSPAGSLNGKFSSAGALFDRTLPVTPAAAEAVVAMDRFSSGSNADRKRVYAAAKAAKERYPQYYRIGAIDDIISSVTARSVNISAPLTVYPGGAVRVESHPVNVNDFTITLWKLPEGVTVNQTSVDPTRVKGIRMVREYPCSVDGTVPFLTDLTTDVVIDKPGKYAITVSFPGQNPEASDRLMRVVTCTRLAPFVAALDRNDLYMVDALSGKPLKGVKVFNYHRPDRTWLSTQLGATDSEGLYPLSPSVKAFVYGRSGTDTSLAANLWSGIDHGKFPVKEWNGRGFTSLPLYHPGDTAEWAAVFYLTEGFSTSLAEGKHVTVTLRDANYDDVETVRAVTDRWGRVSGSFKLPADRLTGTYSIYMTLRENEAGKTLATVYTPLEVSDYKLPTYEVTLDEPRPSASGSYTVNGRLTTYTGMPLQGSEVSLNLSSDNPRFCRWTSSPSLSFYTARTKSGADGSFEFTVPATVLASAPYPRGVFTAEVTAVSATGESRSATIGFAAGKLCLLSVSMPRVADLSKPVIPSSLSLTDVNGKPMTATVSYTVYKESREEEPSVQTDGAPSAGETPVASGTFSSSQPSMDLTALAPGAYRVSFSVPSEPDSEPAEGGTVLLYSLAKGSPSPSERAVWTPAATLTTTPAGDVVVNYATPAGESHVLLTLYNPADGSVKERRWLKSSGGMASVTVRMPDGLDHAGLSLYSLRDFRSAEAAVRLTRGGTERTLRLVTTTLRDRTEPMARQTWRFRLEYEDGTPVEGALMMDMYSKALDKLRRADFTFTPSQGVLDMMSYVAPFPGRLHASAWSDITHTEYPQLVIPDWQTWGMSLTGSGVRSLNGIRIRGGAGYADSEMKLMAAAPMMSKADMADGEMMESVEEHAEEVAVTESAADTGSAAASQPMPAITYRPSEVPLALFKPLLVTDGEGNLEMEVTMPAAVTTWQLDVVAFTRTLLTASLKRTIVASKPLMVQPNLPRFLRCGDRVEVLSSVSNKTDSTLTALVRAEATDLSTGRVVASGSTQVTIAAGAAQTVGVPVEVRLPGGSSLQLKVSARSGSFTDGEMATIPVLTSAASVIESQPFYIPVDSSTVTLAVNPAPADAVRTLQYCDNPLWLCVLALPTLSDPKATTAPDAAANLLMALTAKNVVERFPTIRDAISEWSASDRTDSTLVSMLERDPQLKQLMLASTPWVRQARSDSERMSRLAMLLSGDNMEKAATQAVSRLRELQSSDGGWRWMDRCENSSEWATERVLTLIGSLNEMGWMPADREFNAMTRRAVEYVDAIAAERYRKYPQSSFISYALLRDMFSYTESSGAHQASLAALREARNSWKSMGTVMKARVALLLENHGYGDIGREALASVTQYAQTSPQRGMWWDGVDLLGQVQILRTYFVLKSRGQEVDAIRQWIIFEKEATDWGNTPEASLIVAGLLTTSPTWVEPSKDVTVELDGTPLKVTRSDYGSGFFTQAIPAGSSTLTITHAKGLPSWGAVVSRYEQEATDVTAQSIPDLSIDKSILVADAAASAEGRKWTERTEMPLGSDVTVRLTLRVGRDMDYVSIVDSRASCFEPTEQLPSDVLSQGLSFYMVPGDSQTRIFIDHLPKGTYVLTYRVSANNAGRFAGGIATVQSQMTPSLTAHSAGTVITVNRQ